MPLMFVHNPETAGTMITKLALEHDICWGAYAYNLTAAEKHSDRICDGPVYHQPPLGGLPLIYFDKTFCVIRNPYDRIISFIDTESPQRNGV
eukprot:UN19561